MPYPRTGQGGEPNLTLPDAITGNPGDQGGVFSPSGCYPYRRAAAGPAARRPAARTARTVAARDCVRAGTDTLAGLRARAR